MIEWLFSPIQAAYRWLDDTPAARLVLALGLFAIAIALPLPGPVFDLWILLAVGGSLAMSGLLLAVGTDLKPQEALTSLPGYIRRATFQRLALALALTKAIFLGLSTGVIMDWLAHRALGASVGVGLAVLAAIYAARLAGSHFAHGERLQQAQVRLPAEFARLDEALANGRLSPVVVMARRQRLVEEWQLLGDARQVFRMLRTDTWIGLGLATFLLAAGLLTGLVFKGWPWALTLSMLTLYGLCEAILTALPGLLFGLTLSQWLGTAVEEATLAGSRPESAASPDAGGLALLELEVGREIAGPLRRALPDLVSKLRSRNVRELGFNLPRVELVTNGELAPRAFRLSVRGIGWRSGEVAAKPREEGEAEGAKRPAPPDWDVLAEALGAAVRHHADVLLTIDDAQHLLDDLAAEHPVAVSQALAKHGLPIVHATLQGLLHERVGIMDLGAILEAMAIQDPAPPVVLLEAARRRLMPALVASWADGEATLAAYELGATWDEAFAAMPVVPGPGGSPLVAGAADWGLVRELLAVVRETLARPLPPHVRPVLVVPSRYRPAVAAVLASSHPELAVLSPVELPARHDIRLAGHIERPQERGWKSPLALLKTVGS